MAKILEFPADRIAKGLHLYTPEMGQRKPNCQLEAQLSHYGRHYFVDSPVELPKGRGIELLKQYEPGDFVNGAANRKVGWYCYKVTTRAFEKLQQRYSISMVSHLD